MVTAAAGLLPYAGTGRTTRSAFGLVAAARAAGLGSTGAVRLAAIAFAVAPGLAAGVLAAAAFGWRRTTGTLALVTGAVGIGAAAAVNRSPLRADVGTAVSAAAGAVAAAAAMVVLTAGRARDG